MKLYKLFLLCMLFFYPVNANWVLQKDTIDKTPYSSVNVINENIVYVLGDDKLLKTTDGGENWFVIPLDTSFHCSQFRFVNDSTGWIFSNNGQLLKTINSGHTWIDFSNKLDGLKNLRKMDFINDSIGWVIGLDSLGGVLLETRNSGITWIKKRISSEGNPELLSFYFINDQEGWVNTPTKIFYTKDGGVTFDLQFTEEINYYFNRLFVHYAIDNKNAWGVDHYYTGPKNIYTDLISINSNNNWQKIYEFYSGQSTFPRSIHDIYFVDSVNGFLGSNNLLRTYDGGLSWSDSALFDCYDIDFASKKVGWAVGDGIYKTIDCGDTAFIGDIESQKDYSSTLKILLNKKNRSNLEAIITGTNINECELSIFSINGKLVYNNKRPQHMNNKLIFYISNLSISNGSFIVNVKTNIGNENQFLIQH